MARRNESRRIKERVDPIHRLERAIVTDVQMRRGLFTIVGVSNYTEGDQRAMVRSGENKTLRRRTKIEKLFHARALTAKQAIACEYYSILHTARYSTLGITAQYGDGTSGGVKSYCHGPKTREQQEAYHNFSRARLAIDPFLLPLFEAVVVWGYPIGKIGDKVRKAADQLLDAFGAEIVA